MAEDGRDGDPSGSGSEDPDEGTGDGSTGRDRSPPGADATSADSADEPAGDVDARDGETDPDDVEETGESDGDEDADETREDDRESTPDGTDEGGDVGEADEPEVDTGDESDASATSEPLLGDGSTVESFVDRIPLAALETRAGRAVVGLTVLALVARLLMLGQRTAHWDEGRVAYWVLKSADTGYFEYRPIVHGPFFFQVDKYLFTVFGASDFVARLPVALLGGVLPTTAWLLRDRLRESEMVALAAFLAANPLLVYYSRFMRNDVLVAGFMLFALAFFVRAYDTRDGRYLYPAAVTFALGFTAKENALVYVLCWLGAGALLLDHRLLDAVRSPEVETDGDRIRDAMRSDLVGAAALCLFVLANPLALAVSGTAGSTPAVVGLVVVALASYLGLLRGGNPWHYAGVAGFAGLLVGTSMGMSPFETVAAYTVAWLLAGALLLDEYHFLRPGDPRGEGRLARFPPMLGAYVLFFGILVFFFAPRSPVPGELGLWNALTDPGMLPALVQEALLGGWEKLYATWVSGAGTTLEEFLGSRLPNMINTMTTGAGVLSVFAVGGFAYDRWSSGGPRDIVALSGYWGFVSILGYPYATDIWAPWIAVHAVVPLAIPAAVGVGAAYRHAADLAAFESTSSEARTPGRTPDRAQSDPPVARALVAALLLVLAAPVAVTAVDVAYVNSASSERVLTDLTGGEQQQKEYVMQWAQAGNDLKDTLETVERVARANEGHDVLFYGTTAPGSDTSLFYVPAERCARKPPIHKPEDVCNQNPTLTNWYSRLPLPWYMESFDANTTSIKPGSSLDLVEDVPPVVVAYDWDRAQIKRNLPARYEAHTHRFKLWGESIVVFVDQRAIPER